MKKGMARIVFEVKKELKKELEFYCINVEKTKQTVLTKFLEDFIAKHKPRK